MQRYLAAQLAGHRREALRLVLDEGLYHGLSVAQIQLEVVQPAQYEIGRLWQENQISVAEEHVATAISQLVLAHLYRHLPREAPLGQEVLLACVEGELHDMGARVASDFLEMSGYHVHFAGANVPADHLVRLTRQRRPDLVALSVTMPHHLPALRDTVVRLCEAMGGDYPIAVGGGALGDAGAGTVEGRVLACRDVHTLIDRAPAYPGGRPAAPGQP